jgi:hypothetical protein
MGQTFVRKMAMYMVWDHLLPALFFILTNLDSLKMSYYRLETLQVNNKNVKYGDNKVQTMI